MKFLFVEDFFFSNKTHDEVTGSFLPVFSLISCLEDTEDIPDPEILIPAHE